MISPERFDLTTSSLEAMLGMLVGQVLMSRALGNFTNSFIPTQCQLALSLVIWIVTPQTGKTACPISRLEDCSGFKPIFQSSYWHATEADQVHSMEIYSLQTITTRMIGSEAGGGIAHSTTLLCRGGEH